MTSGRAASHRHNSAAIDFADVYSSGYMLCFRAGC